MPMAPKLDINVEIRPESPDINSAISCGINSVRNTYSGEEN